MVTETRRTRRRSRSRRYVRRWPLFLAAAVLLMALLSLLGQGGQMHRLKTARVPAWVDVQLIDVNGAARWGERMKQVKEIVIHYVGNPGTSAQANRDYFAQPDTQVSAHFLIGLEGEVIQCIPLDEKSSATNERNRDTISIEVCHPDATGRFSQASYDRLVQLTAWLCDTAGLGRDKVIRHYDVTGKDCPRYFVEHPDSWAAFQAAVQDF